MCQEPGKKSYFTVPVNTKSMTRASGAVYLVQCMASSRVIILGGSASRIQDSSLKPAQRHSDARHLTRDFLLSLDNTYLPVVFEILRVRLAFRE
eukprot:jgi/Botrbrau1/3645/Bobra.0204s0035.1